MKEDRRGISGSDRGCVGLWRLFFSFFATDAASVQKISWVAVKISSRKTGLIIACFIGLFFKGIAAYMTDDH